METNKQTAAESPRITTRTLRTFAACACGKRHGHSATETIRRQYIGIRLHASSRITMDAPPAERCTCGRALRWVAVKATKSTHECDARCTNAKGGDCACKCGGANHGRG